MTRFVSRAALCAAALVLGTSLATAADLHRPAPVAATPVYPTLWTGLTFGLHGGYGWGEANAATLVPGLDGGDIDGGIAGAQIGYSWQTGSWVFGVEGDFAWSGIKGSDSTPVDVLGDPGVARLEGEINWLSTVRGRVGYAPDRWQIYATGGVAFADFDGVSNVTVGGFPFYEASASKTHVGWTIGAGVDYALTDNWRLGLEYKYLDFGDETYTFPASDPIDVDFNFHSVTARLNYKF